MSILTNKIDFAVIFSVKNANPNGDPLNDNMPRATSDNHGEISDVCLKRKIRNRLMDVGLPILVRPDDRPDGFKDILSRTLAVNELKELCAPLKKNEERDLDSFRKIACEHWIDVRTFGQVFAFKGKGEDNSEKAKGISLGIRGPVSIQAAYSVEPVTIVPEQITKCTSLDIANKASDTMGMKYHIEKGIYVTYGSISPQLAELTGFTEEDAEDLKEALKTLFANDVSAGRPDGSMEVIKIVWWVHPAGQPEGVCSAAKVHRSLTVDANGECTFEEIEGVQREVIQGF